jgi:VanZ family protein
MFKLIDSSKLKTAFQVLLIGYWATLLIGTHLPPKTPFLPSEAHNLDKLYHLVAYALLAGLFATTWQLSAGTLNIAHLVWVWIAVVVWAAIDEITQIAFNRDCSFWDWTADAIGAAIALLAFVWLRKMLSARTAPSE